MGEAHTVTPTTHTTHTPHACTPIAILVISLDSVRVVSVASAHGAGHPTCIVSGGPNIQASSGSLALLSYRQRAKFMAVIDERELPYDSHTLDFVMVPRRSSSQSVIR